MVVDIESLRLLGACHLAAGARWLGRLAFFRGAYNRAHRVGVVARRAPRQQSCISSRLLSFRIIIRERCRECLSKGSALSIACAARAAP
jgi:hypothetical protein